MKLFKSVLTVAHQFGYTFFLMSPKATFSVASQAVNVAAERGVVAQDCRWLAFDVLVIALQPASLPLASQTLDSSRKQSISTEDENEAG